MWTHCRVACCWQPDGLVQAPGMRPGFVPMHPVPPPILRASLCMAERAVGYVFAFQCATQDTTVCVSTCRLHASHCAIVRSSLAAIGWGRAACVRRVWHSIWPASLLVLQVCMPSCISLLGVVHPLPGALWLRQDRFPASQYRE